MELVGVDVEGNPANISEQQVTRARRQVVCEQAQRERAVAASAGLEQRQWAMPEHKPLEHRRRLGSGTYGSRFVADEHREILFRFGDEA
jgi:sRNA-binding protein